MFHTLYSTGVTSLTQSPCLSEFKNDLAFSNYKFGRIKHKQKALDKAVTLKYIPAFTPVTEAKQILRTAGLCSIPERPYKKVTTTTQTFRLVIVLLVMPDIFVILVRFTCNK